MRRGRATMADKAKVQNCPNCGKEPSEYVPGSLAISCKTDDCILGLKSFLKEDWNRIRISPDDKDIVRYDQEDEEMNKDKQGNYCEFEYWMNPRWPDDE